MATIETATRHDNVDFHFLGAEEDSNLIGTVIIRDREMVLDIPGGYGPYVLVGKACKHWFEGENIVSSRRYDTAARWADVGGTYIGTWVEHGWDYLFSFRLGTGAGSTSDSGR
jgi:hypothetical protein